MWNINKKGVGKCNFENEDNGWTIWLIFDHYYISLRNFKYVESIDLITVWLNYLHYFNSNYSEVYFSWTIISIGSTT